MKRGVLGGLIGMLFTAVLWCNPIKANAESYYWDDEQTTVSGGDAIATGGWYKGGTANQEDSVKLDGMPELTSQDAIYIYYPVNEETGEWLKSLSGKVRQVYVGGKGVVVQFGSPDAQEKLEVDYLYANAGDVTFYGNVDVALPTSTIGSELNVIGNVGVLALGDLNQVKKNNIVNITGNVAEVEWYPKNDNENYAGGFIGSVRVSGTVAKGGIYDLVYDEVLEAEGWRVVKNIGSCAAGVFQMTDGVLASEVPVMDAEIAEINYKYKYQLYNGNSWQKQTINADTNAVVRFDNCTIDDIPEGAHVTLYAAPVDETMVLTVNLSYLHIYNRIAGEVASFVLNGNVEEMVVSGYRKCGYNVTVNGDVEKLNITQEYQPNRNLTVTGNVASGGSKVNGDYCTFTCSDMQIIQNGNWNPNLFMKVMGGGSDDNGDVSYQVVPKEEVNDALASENIGEEVIVTTDAGEVTLVKDANVTIAQTATETLSALVETEGVKEALNQIKETIIQNSTASAAVKAITAIDIDISTLYRNAETNEIFTGDANYGENPVTQLAEGKKLEFTIKVPTDLYDADAKYSVVRHHENVDGSKAVEVLETRQEGDVLHFASDKFSTFVVVMATQQDMPATTPTPAPAATATPAPTEEPVATPTPAPAATATPAPTEEPVATPTPTPAATATPAPTGEPAVTPESPAEEEEEENEEVVVEEPKVVVNVTYTVERGDNLYKIAAKNGISLGRLLALNPQIKNPNMIYRGQIIVVGTKETVAGEEAVHSVPMPTIPVNAEYYTVVKGDTLYKIARSYQLRLSDLYSMNTEVVNQKYIYAGQRIRVK